MSEYKTAMSEYKTAMSDQDISRTLSALSHAEPPTGLERRVLLAVEQRVHAQSERKHFTAAWIAVPATIVLAALLVLTHRNPAQPTQQASSPPALPFVVIPQETVPSPIRVPHISLLRCGSSPTRIVTGEPGYPAPEAPLTDQEKLLLRLARRPNEGIVAMFDPAIREERAAADKAEFDFFNPPRPFQSAEEILNQIQEPYDEVSPGKQ